VGAAARGRPAPAEHARALPAPPASYDAPGATTYAYGPPQPAYGGSPQAAYGGSPQAAYGGYGGQAYGYGHPEQAYGAPPAPYAVGQYTSPGAYAGHGHSDSGTPSFAPGEVVFASPLSPPATATAAQPVFFVPQRANSRGHAHEQPLPSLPGTPVSEAPHGYGAASMPPSRRESEYVDLARSSVTPFQARTYAEISNRLDAMPESPERAESSEGSESVAAHMPALPESPNPFSDPAAPVGPPTPEAEAPTHEDDTQEIELEAPPAIGSLPRITSVPPSLPPLTPEPERVFSMREYDFALAPAAASASGLASPATFPSTPLPPTTPGHESADAHAFARAQAQAPAPAPMRRPETVFDPEDAYDGI
jgi:hypothetical protein